MVANEPDVLVPAGESIVIAYQIQISVYNQYTNASYTFEYGTNSVYVSYNENSLSTVGNDYYFKDTIGYQGASPIFSKGIMKEQYNGAAQTFDSDNIYSDRNSTKNVSGLDKAALEDLRFNYVMCLANQNGVKYSYDEGITYVISDAVPEGLELVEGSVSVELGTFYVTEQNYENGEFCASHLFFLLSSFVVG